MSLNIKDKEAHRLAEKLARMTGKSMTRAVIQALRERIDRVEQTQARVERENNMSLSEKLLMLGKECSGRLKEPFRSADHGELLYNDRGLPK